MATPLSPKRHRPNPNFTISIKTAARKLPVKRKPQPEPQQTPLPLIKTEPDLHSSPECTTTTTTTTTTKTPNKFQRLWPESDEIRFLLDLVNCSNDGMLFPRDMDIFYHRFTQNMPFPYTKSQLSEKLRRLKKKFRAVSAKIARGALDPSRMPPHQRALFDLSKQFWGAQPQPLLRKTPPCNNHLQEPAPADKSLPPPLKKAKIVHPDENHGDDSWCSGDLGLRFGRDTAKAVLNVFDTSLKEVRMVLVRRGLLCPDPGKGSDLQKKWREQRVAELDVLARRLQLVLEDTVSGKATLSNDR